MGRRDEEYKEKRRIEKFLQIAGLVNKNKIAEAKEELDKMMEEATAYFFVGKRIPIGERDARKFDFRSKFWRLVSRYNGKGDKRGVVDDFCKNWNYMFTPLVGF